MPIFWFELINHENKSEVLLSINDMNSKEEKHNRQFGHPTPLKLIELLKNTDINNKKLCVIMEEIMK